MSSYSLSTSYVGQSLIDGFNFVSIVDPTGGFVAYQDYNDAVAAGLVSVDDTTQAVTLSVDTTNIYNPDGSQGGRPSVRIESFEAFNEGLLIGDFAHMPGSVCGGWPAFWMYGPNWPNDGEVDIIEGANMAYTNLMSAHTSANCLLPSTGDFSGTQEITDCNNPDGCNYIPPTSDTSSYGDDFNAVGGGVYALEWTSDILRIWHFARGGIPQDIIDQQPNPSNWGTPQALFGTDSCDVSTHFANMSIVLNIDFCGNYGDALWGSGSCSSYAATCEDFVGNNPSALTDLYWEVNYIDFYSMSAGSTTTTLPSISTESSVPVNGSVTRGPSIRRSTTLPSASATTTPETTSSGNGNGVGTPTTTAASSSAPSPVDSIVPRHNPATIGPFTYLGCFTSGTGFSTFDLAGTDPALTLEECTSLCGGSTYAGAIDQTCYCADVLDANTFAVADRLACDHACPGNDDEYCGGILGSPLLSSRVTLSKDTLLTMYGNIHGANSTAPKPAPALGRKGSSKGNATVTQTITSTVTYVTVCSTNPAQLETLTYCSTITVCPTAKEANIIPLATLTQTCDRCGYKGESTVTLTVPKVFDPTQTVNVTAATGAYRKPQATASPFTAGAAASPNGMSALALLMVAVAAAGTFFV